jgi:hypothetical protein
VSTAPPQLLRTLAFGDLAAGPWGFVWDDGTGAVLVTGTLGKTPSAPVVRPVSLTGEPEDEQWLLSGEGTELRVTAGHGQLCGVAGALSAGGVEHELETLGLRATLPAPVPAALDSLRVILAWFTPEDGVAFAAARSRGASGQERDEVTASVFDSNGAVSIDDGRLSTTYSGAAPLRMSLEMWVDDEEDAFPRRAAGEVIDDGTEVAVSGLTLDVRALHSHRAGHDGLGVYVLARPR